jgi:hypothetical protein
MRYFETPPSGAKAVAVAGPGVSGSISMMESNAGMPLRKGFSIWSAADVSTTKSTAFGLEEPAPFLVVFRGIGESSCFKTRGWPKRESVVRLHVERAFESALGKQFVKVGQTL